MAWATLPTAGRDGHWWAFRLSAVRGFARYLHALDHIHQIAPADVLPNRAHRAIPYLYSQQEIVALMAATSALRGELRQATYRTLIGLNAAALLQRALDVPRPSLPGRAPAALGGMPPQNS